MTEIEPAKEIVKKTPSIARYSRLTTWCKKAGFGRLYDCGNCTLRDDQQRPVLFHYPKSQQTWWSDNGIFIYDLQFAGHILLLESDCCEIDLTDENWTLTAFLIDFFYLIEFIETLISVNSIVLV